MKKRASKRPSDAMKYMGSGGAKQTAKRKVSRQERLQKALGQAQKARKANTRKKGY